MPGIRVEPNKAPVPVDDLQPMPFDHNRVVRLAIDELRDEYLERADPAHFLPKAFT